MLENYGKIIAQNLKRIAYEQNRTQSEICRALDLSDSTVSSWFNGTRIPRMDKVDLLANYFNCTRADIMEPYKTSSIEEFRFSPDVIEVAQLLQQLKHDDLVEIRGTIKGILMSYREKDTRSSSGSGIA